MYVFSADFHPGCAADHGCASAPATLGFGELPLRGEESDHSTSDDALDEESLTALVGSAHQDAGLADKLVGTAHPT